MRKRLKQAVIGTATVAVLGVGAITGPGVFAQSATPAATSGTTANGTTANGTATATTKDAAEQAEYQAFITALGTNLGISDPTKVDAAIRAALKQMVDDQFTAGNISANEATAEKAAIDASSGAGLLNLGMGMHGGPGGHGNFGGRPGMGQPGDNGHPNGDNDQNGQNGNGASGNSANGTAGNGANGTANSTT